MYVFLFLLLHHATVDNPYSRNAQFPILTGDLRERVAFVINAMHAFGHEFICQIVYNPRMVPGLGLTDQEGVERFWSRIRKLIPITRGQWVCFFHIYHDNV